MAKGNPIIFVIVVTYKGMQWYDKCFSSLRESAMPVQTIVVDNTPGEEDANYIREHFPEIHLIKTEENLGFGRANNIAMRYALEHGCDYVFLLNQDTWLTDTDMFSRLLAVAEGHPEYGIISPLHMSSDEKNIVMMYEQGRVCGSTMFMHLYCGELRDAYETNYINAAAWLLPRNTLETVGGFDPIYQHYEEDDDYLNRVRYHGLKIILCPKIKLVHDHQKSENPFASSKAWYYHQQRLLVKLTDINVDDAITANLRYTFRHLLTSVLTLKFQSLAYWNKEMSFILKSRKRVKLSRDKNSLKNPTWL